MLYVILGVIIIGGVVFALRQSRIQNRKRILYRIRERFGNVPDREFVQKNLQYFLDSEHKKYNIDDVTWNDLDMDSVYTRINNCNSFIGEQVLYSNLHSITKMSNEIEKREKIIRGFMKDTRRREDAQVILERLGRRNTSYFLPMFIKEIEMFKIAHIWIYRLLSVLLLATLIGAIINQYFLYAAFAVFLVNLLIYTFGKSRFELHIGMLGAVIGVVTTAETLIQKYKIDDIELAEESIDGVKQMKKAVKRITVIERKMGTALAGDIGGIIFDYLIGSTLWDFHIYHSIVKLLISHKEEFMKLYTYIGEIDALISIASFRKSVPHYCQASFHESARINFKEMYHPLVNDPVCNDVKMDTNYIITGSNASGKSTYIKAIAINMILAQSINTVMAISANIPCANILTSMAVRDDILTGESYYMKEINYLKRIVTHLKADKLTLCIVDEILRGTNTEERIAASVATLNYMNNKNCIVIVASHDVEIPEMLKGKYENCHFSEAITKGDILFDYKVKSGVSRSQNAIKLLRQVGFPEEIVKNAEELVKHKA